MTQGSLSIWDNGAIPSISSRCLDIENTSWRFDPDPCFDMSHFQDQDCLWRGWYWVNQEGHDVAKIQAEHDGKAVKLITVEQDGRTLLAMASQGSTVGNDKFIIGEKRWIITKWTHTVTTLDGEGWCYDRDTDHIFANEHGCDGNSYGLAFDFLEPFSW